MIPKILHQIWLGSNPLPEQYHQNLQQFKDLHPDWTVMEWTDENLPTLINQNEFDALTNYTNKAEIIKHEVLNLHGGLYLDRDIIILKNMDELLSNGDFLVRLGTGTSTGNAVLGADENSPFFAESVRCLPGWMMSRSIDVKRSPGVVGAPFTIEVWQKKFPTMTILPQATFFPYLRGENIPAEVTPEMLPDSYGIHTWDAV